MRRLIVGMTGATGAIFGVRLLEALKACEVESHLILSKWAQQTIEHETPYTVDQVSALATVTYAPANMGATISSGSFITEGMVVIPCSMRTLGCIAHGYGEHLVHRAADVILKERRRLVLVTRRVAAIRGTPGEHAQIGAHGGNNTSANACLLQPSPINNRYCRSYRRTRA